MNYHHNAILEYFHQPKKTPPTHVQPIPVPTPSSKQPLIYFLSIAFMAGILNNSLCDFTLFTAAGSHISINAAKHQGKWIIVCFLNKKMSLISVISFLLFTQTYHIAIKKFQRAHTRKTVFLAIMKLGKDIHKNPTRLAV